MGNEAFGKALEAMVNDGEAASMLAEGNFDALPDQDLTAAEQALLQAAAGEIPEVSGFSNSFLKLGYIGETEKNIISLVQIRSEFGPRFREASDFYQYKLED